MSLLIGLCAGIFGGLVGLGGGVIMIPLLTGVIGLDQHKAHGTSLVALVFTGASGAVSYGIQGSVDVAASALMAATAVVTVQAGARVADTLSELGLERSFGGFLVFVALLMLAKPYLPHVSGLDAGWPKVAVLLSTGAFAGFLSGMMGVGGGTVMVPAMVLLAGFDQHAAQGSALLAMVPAGGVGAFAHWRLGNVRPGLLPGLVPGILAGAAAGGVLAHFLSDGAMRAVFAAVLIAMGVRDLTARRR